MPRASRPALVDAHIHLWDLEALRYPWLTPPFDDGAGPTGNVAAIASTYRLDDYLADAAGWTLEGVVHVEAGADPEHALAETRGLQSVADATALPMALVVAARLDTPDVERRLAEQVESAAVRGVRQILNWHPDPRLTYTPRDLLDGNGDGAFARGFALLAKYGLSFDLQIYPSQMRAAAALAARHPDVPVILNHAGMPVDRDPAGVARWREGLRALAELANVSIKISGFGILEPAWTVESIRPFVREAIEVFGVERAMIASDVPTDKLFAPFTRILDAYDVLTADLGEEARAVLFGGAARRIYRLAEPARATPPAASRRPEER